MPRIMINWTTTLVAIFHVHVINWVRAHDVIAPLRFARSERGFADTSGIWPNVSADSRRRWIRNMNVPEHDLINMAEHFVKLRDISNGTGTRLLEHGFERVALAERLWPTLKRIGRAGALSGRARVGANFGLDSAAGRGGGGRDDETALAHGLRGMAFPLKGGLAVNLVCSGFVLRKGGPLGKKIPGEAHDWVAQRVHIDQDLEGEPLRRMGMAWAVKYAPFLEVLNVWTPLATPRLRPLALMDLRTLRENDDVLRYRANSTRNAGGRAGSFVSDRLMPVFNRAQRWHWDSGMVFGHAMLFLTGKTAHSSFSLPGVEIILDEFRAAFVAYAAAEPTAGPSATAACAGLLRARAKAMSLLRAAAPPLTEQLVRRVSYLAASLCRGDPVNGVTPLLDAGAAARAVAEGIAALERASLEIRCATLVVTPGRAARFLAVVAAGVAWWLMRRPRRRRRREKRD